MVPATALTIGTSTLNTYVEGVTATSNTLQLGITTQLMQGGKITCTYDKAIFTTAAAAVTVTANPSSGAHTATATSDRILFITAVGAPIATGTTSFALTSNLAANPAAGAVGVSCISTTDVAALDVTSYTTTAVPLTCVLHERRNTGNPLLH